METKIVTVSEQKVVPAESVKTTFGLTNINAGNTPKWIQVIGNIGLLLASLGGSASTVILGYMAHTPPIMIFGPYTLTILAIVTGIGAVGAILKGTTKMFGQTTIE